MGGAATECGGKPLRGTACGRSHCSSLVGKKKLKFCCGAGQSQERSRTSGVASGEAGIGKSRLTAALLEAIASEPHTRLRNFCSPQRTDSALYPTIGQIERAAGFTRDDILAAKLDKLDVLLAQSSTSAQDAALCRDAVAAQRRALSAA